MVEVLGRGGLVVDVAAGSPAAEFPASISNPGGAYYPIRLPGSMVNYTTSYVERSTQLWLMPFLNNFSTPITKWAAYVKTASAGQVMRMAIYDVDPITSLPTGAPLYESDNMDCSATGLVTSNFSLNTVTPIASLELPKFFYLGMAFSDAVVQVQSANSANHGQTWQAVDANGAQVSMYQNFTMGVPTGGVAAMPTIASPSLRGEAWPVGGFVE